MAKEIKETKETLREHLNRKIKDKGSSLAKEKAKASKYKSISAAKKAGSLYYTNKDGKVMAAVYAEDLKFKFKGIKSTGKITVSVLPADASSNRGKANRTISRKRKPGGVDPLGLAGPKTYKKIKKK